MKTIDERGEIAYEFGPFRLDPSNRVLLKEGVTVSLSPKAFDTLLVLIQHGGAVVDKSVLLKQIWPDTDVEENSVAKSVSEARKALGEDSRMGRYVVTASGRGYRFAAALRTIRATPETTSLAVLPFLTLGADKAHDYLAVGMADALIARLCRVRQLVVRPTSSIVKYAGMERASRLAGTELDVDAVIEGSIRRAGDRIRVSVQLTHTKTTSTLWAEQFDEDVADVFALEDSISERVMSALTPKLSGQDLLVATKRYTSDRHAYESFMKGRVFAARRTMAGLLTGIDHFTQAIERDRRYAVAYAGLAEAHTMLGISGAALETLSPASTIPHARVAAARALELDSDLVDARVTLALITFFYDWNYIDAERAFKDIVASRQDFGPAHHRYAMALAFMGRHDEALDEIERARALEPTSAIINANAGRVLYHARQYDAALQQLRMAIEMEPGFCVTHHRLGLVFEAQHLLGPALAAFEEAQRLAEGGSVATAAIGYVHALAGREREARQILDALIERTRAHYVSAALIAEIYTALDDVESAFTWLGQACDERSPGMTALQVNPRFDRLRSDRRFMALLTRAGIKPIAA
jgi:TolB-like protein/Tfp pilus assembly protein PilF